MIGSYKRAAAAARATLLPAGAAWREAWDCDARLPLYGPDGLHPSALGTQLAALVAFGRLFRAPLVTAKIRRTRILQKSAARVLGGPVRGPCS